ncbi:MAG: PDZ domain-containing protein [bacterium]|nr:PDZ domain-containing protein [bacterium]
MKRMHSTIAAALIGFTLSGCAGLEEKTLLEPSRARPDLGLRLRVSPPDEVPEVARGRRSRILRVVLVRADRPAARANIQPGDILLSLDGKPVSGMDDSVGIMQTHQWGDSVILTILRDGRMQTVSVALTPNQATDFRVEP